MIFKKYYIELELPDGADDAEIKAAYRRLVKIYHPDKSGTRLTRDKFIRINEAYDVLNNRKEYLQLLLLKHYLQKKQKEEILRRNHADAVHKARHHADIEYEAFTRSRIYRTAMVLNNAFNYVFLAVGLFMIFAPVFAYYFMPEKDNSGREIQVFYSLPLIIGLVFSSGVGYFLIKERTT